MWGFPFKVSEEEGFEEGDREILCGFVRQSLRDHQYEQEQRGPCIKAYQEKTWYCWCRISGCEMRAERQHRAKQQTALQVQTWSLLCSISAGICTTIQRSVYYFWRQLRCLGHTVMSAFCKMLQQCRAQHKTMSSVAILRKCSCI